MSTAVRPDTLAPTGLTVQWAAGFFEGEGSMGLYEANRPGYLFPQIRITQWYSCECLWWFLDIVGAGDVHGPHQRAGGIIGYSYSAGGKDALLVANTIRPFLTDSGKGAQVDDVLSRYEEFRKGYVSLRHKLSESDVIAIRQKFESGAATKAELAEEYGVGRSNIRSVVTYQTWRHV